MPCPAQQMSGKNLGTDTDSKGREGLCSPSRYFTHYAHLEGD